MIRVSSDAEDKRTAIILTLRRYRSKVAEYQACRDLYNQLYPSGTIHLTDMPKAASDTYEPERWASRRWDQRERMERSLDAMREALAEIEQMVDKLEGDYRTVLLRRYLLNESYETIAVKMNFSLRSVKYKHHHALNKLCTLLHS